MRLLRQPRLALLFAGAALNEIGSWASIVAFWGYAAYRFHSGPDQIALVSVMWSAPGAVFSLITGWPIDRFGPKATMIAADLLGVATALGMVWADSYGALVALVLASGTVGAFGRPAASSLAALTGFGGLIATPLAGVAVGAFGIRACALALGGALLLAGLAGGMGLQAEANRPSRAVARAG